MFLIESNVKNNHNKRGMTIALQNSLKNPDPFYLVTSSGCDSYARRCCISWRRTGGLILSPAGSRQPLNAWRYVSLTADSSEFLIPVWSSLKRGSEKAFKMGTMPGFLIIVFYHNTNFIQLSSHIEACCFLLNTKNIYGICKAFGYGKISTVDLWLLIEIKLTRSHMDGNEVRQGYSSLQSHSPVGVVQGLHEGSLHLRKERLQQRPSLL